MNSNSQRVVAWRESLGLCEYEGCKRHASRKSPRLCQNHYDQTPAGRDLRLRQKYGLKPGEFENLMKMQDSSCGICGAKESIGRDSKATRLVVDHDHDTKAVRGLLCALCNKSLGGFQDDPNLLRKALTWLNQDDAMAPIYFISEGKENASV